MRASKARMAAASRPGNLARQCSPEGTNIRLEWNNTDPIQDDLLEVDAVILPALDVYPHDALVSHRLRSRFRFRFRAACQCGDCDGGAAATMQGDDIGLLGDVHRVERLVVNRYPDTDKRGSGVRTQVECKRRQILNVQLEARPCPTP